MAKYTVLFFTHLSVANVLVRAVLAMKTAPFSKYFVCLSRNLSATYNDVHMMYIYWVNCYATIRASPVRSPVQSSLAAGETQPLILLRSEYEYRVKAGPMNWVNSN